MLPEIKNCNTDFGADEVILIRQLAAMTQKQFALALGCSEMTIKRWEKSRCQPDHVYVRQMTTMRKELLAMEPDKFSERILGVTKV